jgi:hypothetical protein
MNLEVLRRSAIEMMRQTLKERIIAMGYELRASQNEPPLEAETPWNRTKGTEKNDT